MVFFSGEDNNHAGLSMISFACLALVVNSSAESYRAFVVVVEVGLKGEDF